MNTKKLYESLNLEERNYFRRCCVEYMTMQRPARTSVQERVMLYVEKWLEDCDLVTESDYETLTKRIVTGKQSGGINRLSAAATITDVDLDAGQLTLEGAYAITTLNIKDGTVFANNKPAAGAALVTINLDGGELNASQSLEARTWTTLNVQRGTRMDRDWETLYRL